MSMAESPHAPLVELSQQDQLAAMLKACADPIRLEILRVLAGDSFGVLELCQILDVKQPAMSHHLKVLAKAGLVATRREGNSIFYRRHNPVAEVCWAGLHQSLLQTVDTLPLAPDRLDRLRAVQHARVRASQRFFDEHADGFRARQEQIVDLAQYADTVRQLLDDWQRPAGASALEIGPGEGEFLGALSPRFARVTALDNAPAMLARARQWTERAGLDNIRFECGDCGQLIQAQERFDCIVVNMVLHHVAQPEEMLAQCAQLLAARGTLVITELCAHDQAWVREACGDVWLGFEPTELTAWAQSAGLETGQNIVLALRNGFRIQVRQFFRNATKVVQP